MKEIKLTQNCVALVDDEDYDKLCKYRWCAHFTGSTKRPYAEASMNMKIIRMHRFIMGIIDPKVFIDHKDRNSLNNQKYNLRICTSSDNQKNKKPRGVSRYMGVSLHRNKKWLASININKKQKYLGLFEIEIDAAKAYNKAAIETGNEFYKINIFK